MVAVRARSSGSRNRGENVEEGRDQAGQTDRRRHADFPDRRRKLQFREALLPRQGLGLRHSERIAERDYREPARQAVLLRSRMSQTRRLLRRL